MENNLVVWCTCGGFMTMLTGYVIGSVGVTKVAKKADETFVRKDVYDVHIKTMYKKIDEVATDVKTLLSHGGNDGTH